jgi:MraZ protein
VAKGFYGTFTPRLDDKGRVTLPALYRKQFADGAMVVRGDSNCLYLFTEAEFEEFAQEAVNTPVTDVHRIGPSRYMLANSEPETPDAQGRILLSARMREFAGLDRDVVLTGQGRRMEIWNVDRWRAYEAAQEPRYVDPSLRDTGTAAPGTPPAGSEASGRADS